MQFPRLFCLSTVCLLKHYNQNYPLHHLRTDFTGPNGVGKSIIADLFQIVFIADAKFIKFATEGIDSKQRKIEKLPFQSGIAYVFFTVEVEAGQFIILGSAIFSQGTTPVKPFIITSNIAYDNTLLLNNCFGADRILFYEHFLKENKEPFALDELAVHLSSARGLYLHYFSTKEERADYHSWLYKNKLIPINLAKESNLKAYAKVIQSFSKSKSLDIGNSHSLIEYLFEENEHEIEMEFKQQEQAVQKLLHQFKETRQNIDLIRSKQSELTKLHKLDALRQESQYKLYSSDYLISKKRKNEKEQDLTRTDETIKQKQTRLQELVNRREKFVSIVNVATARAAQANQAYDKLVESKRTFDAIETYQTELEIMVSLQTEGLLTNPHITGDLLNNSAQYFSKLINKWRDVLTRYDSIQKLRAQKEKQDAWLKHNIRKIDETESTLNNFKKILTTVDKKSLFLQGLTSMNKQLTEGQKAVLLHLMDVSFQKPSVINHKTRYTNSLELLREENINRDTENQGWWLQTGELSEFISNKSLVLSGIPNINGKDFKALEDAIDKQMELLGKEKTRYENLNKGIRDSSIPITEFDIDLSDYTKISEIEQAACLCGLVQRKRLSLNGLYQQQVEWLANVKKEFRISSDDLSFGTLTEQLKIEKDHFGKRKDNLSHANLEEQSEIKSLENTVSNLTITRGKLYSEYLEVLRRFNDVEKTFSDTYPDKPFPTDQTSEIREPDIEQMESEFKIASEAYLASYNQIIGEFDETRMQRDVRVNEQVSNQTYSFQVLEETLLGKKIRALDHVTPYLEALNIELLNIADELLKSITKVFGKTEKYYDNYRMMIQSLNTFFRGHLISNRFYFKINFLPNPKLDINWIEQLRKSAHSLANSSKPEIDLTPEQFVEKFYIEYSGSKSRVPVSDLLNPKRYFVLKGELTDEKNNIVPGSTGESYTAISLLGIARLSVVQDGDRAGLRFIILEESATLDNVNFAIFPQVAEKYGYQIMTMTPKPYAIGSESGWYIHHLLPGQENPDVNYPKVISYFRTVSDRQDLNIYLKVKNQ